jgi:lysozyme family protein
MANLKTILPISLEFEGGWVDNPKDPGGATMKGITYTTFREFYPSGTLTQLRAISDADIEHIYDVGYFQPIGGATLSQGVAMVAFDYAGYSGVSRAKDVLTITANLTGIARVQKICDLRLSFLHGLTTWKYFGTGWGTRVGECEAQGIRFESIDEIEAKATISESAVRANQKTVVHASTGTVVVMAASALVATSTGSMGLVPPKHGISMGLEIVLGGGFISLVLVLGLLAFHNSRRAAALVSKV